MEKQKRVPTPRELVMEQVINRLYFGKRPSDAELAMNGSILNRLNSGRNYPWEQLQQVVEGLAILRDQGKLMPTVKPTEPVSLRWVYDSGQMLNQVQVCLDAFYSAPAKPVPKRGGTVTGIADVLSSLSGGR